MSRNAHRTVIGIIVVLLVVMGILLFRGPRFDVKGGTVSNGGTETTVPDLHVRCGAVLTVGWPTDGAILNTSPHSTFSFDFDPLDAPMGNAGDSILTGLDQQCNERRDTYVGFLIVLVIPVCLLGALVTARRPRVVSVPAAEG